MPRTSWGLIERNKMTALTLKQAVATKRNERAKSEARFAKATAAQAAKIAKFTPRTDLHPAVGVLMNAKGVRYYAFVGGVYREGTPEHLASLLA
jgi:hypothetical protein